MAAILKGTTIKISFGSFSYVGYVPEDVTLSYPNGNVEVIKDADGATQTKVLMDPATKVDLTVVILTAGSITPPIVGATVGLIPPSGTLTSFYVESADAKFSAGATRLTMSLIKEGSMTYS